MKYGIKPSKYNALTGAIGGVVFMILGYYRMLPLFGTGIGGVWIVGGGISFVFGMWNLLTKGGFIEKKTDNDPDNQ